MTALLICDIGTTGLRAAIVDGDATIRHVAYRSFPPDTPFDGLVEFDAAALAATTLDAAREAVAAAGVPLTAVGISNQRATTVVWDRISGEPIAPALGWQDLRSAGDCIAIREEHGLAFAPNQSATKLTWLLANTPGADDRDLCFGTVDSWLLWTLTGGEVHATDRTNAGLSGLVTHDATAWDEQVCRTLGIPMSMLPRIVDTTGSTIGHATVLDGAPPITSLAGDQQASMVGQACVTPGLAKITVGTGGMLDVCTGDAAPPHGRRGPHGTFPIVGWSQDGTSSWGREGIMLSAGTNVEWLRDDLGLLEHVGDAAEIAAQCDSTDGVVYVPAMIGLGTPRWDFGARGALLGLSRGAKAPQITRAVLEGVAHRGADLVEAAEADADLTIGTLRIDGGMSANPVFIQALANATGRTIEVSPVLEATTVGSALLAGIGAGVWSSVEDAARTWRPGDTVEPTTQLDRERWHTAVDRAAAWHPDLSALDFV